MIFILHSNGYFVDIRNSLKISKSNEFTEFQDNILGIYRSRPVADRVFIRLFWPTVTTTTTTTTHQTYLYSIGTARQSNRLFMMEARRIRPSAYYYYIRAQDDLGTCAYIGLARVTADHETYIIYKMIIILLYIYYIVVRVVVSRACARKNNIIIEIRTNYAMRRFQGQSWKKKPSF